MTADAQREMTAEEDKAARETIEAALLALSRLRKPGPSPTPYMAVRDLIAEDNKRIAAELEALRKTWEEGLKMPPYQRGPSPDASVRRLGGLADRCEAVNKAIYDIDTHISVLTERLDSVLRKEDELARPPFIAPEVSAEASPVLDFLCHAEARLNAVSRALVALMGRLDT